MTIGSTSGGATNPQLSVIIVNWNVGALLHECLKSIFAHTRNINFEVIVVDNGSREGDLGAAQRDFSEVQFHLLGNNLGFASANNLGLQHARGEFVALLNPDTYVTDDSLGAMVRYLREHPEVGAVGPKLRNPEGRLQVDAGRNFPNLLTEFSNQFFLYRLFPRSRIWGNYNMTWWDHRDTREVGAVCGACMMVRSEAIREVGPLDERIFLYSEDVDWCYRIRHAGWKIVYLAEAEVVHLGGQSTAQDPVKSYEAGSKACIYFFRKHYGPLRCFAVRLLFFFGSILRLFVWLSLSLLKKHSDEAKVRLKGYWRLLEVAISHKLDSA